MEENNENSNYTVDYKTRLSNLCTKLSLFSMQTGIFSKYVYSLHREGITIYESSGTIVLDIKGEGIQVEQTESVLFCEFDGAYIRGRKVIYDTPTGIKTKEVSRYKILTNELYLLEGLNDYAYSLVNKSMEKLTPALYRNAYVTQDSPYQTIIGITLSAGVVSTYTDKADGNTIVYDKKKDTVDGLYRLSIAGQTKYNGLVVDIKNGNELVKLCRYNQIINNKTFEGFSASNNKIDRGLIQTHSTKRNKTYMGLMDTDGNELIKPDKYDDIEETPFKGIYICKVKSSGTDVDIVKSGVGAVVTDRLHKKQLLKLNIISFKDKKTKSECYLGNDGQLHFNLVSAFNIKPYETTNKRYQGLFRINVYGYNYIINEKLDNIQIPVCN